MAELTPEEIKQLEADAKATEAEATVEGVSPSPPREPLSKMQLLALRAAIAAAILAPLWFVVAALGSKFEIWPWQFGLGKMTFQWGPMILMAAISIGVISLIIQLVKAPRRGALLVVIAALIPAMMLGRMKGIGDQVRGLPPIHDVQTDWDNPIELPQALHDERVANGWNPVMDDPVVSERAAGNWPNAVGKRVADLQAEAYAEFNLRPHLFQIKPDIALEAAIETAKKQGWDIVSIDRKARLIHATETSFWFGFTDDVLIQVEPQGTIGSRINARSISRVGLSDMGANATRLKGFIDDISLLLKDVELS